MEAASIPDGDRSFLERSPLARLPDRLLKYGLTTLAALILALIVYFFIRLTGQAGPAFAKFGVFGFAFDNRWNVSLDQFGALPLVVGTLVTSVIALIIGVPIAVATALYITELCPRTDPHAGDGPGRAARRRPVCRLRALGNLLPRAKAPAGRAVGGRPPLVPPVLRRRVGHDPQLLRLRAGPRDHDPPDRRAISREVMATVPADHKEAALGLGATRWEMVRIAVIPYCRSGIVGGAMLGLGRAIGETIAVTILIGDTPTLGHHLFGQGYSLAAVVANEFGEATGLHRSALFAAGLVLFVLTLVVNGIARYFVTRAGRGTRVGSSGGGSGRGAIGRGDGAASSTAGR